MSLHRLSCVRVRVAGYDEFCGFYRRFGLIEQGPGRFATSRGGEQLLVEAGDANALLEISMGADDESDIDALADRLASLGIDADRPAAASIEFFESILGVRIRVAVEERVRADPPAGNAWEVNRGELVARSSVTPQRLGHMVVGCTDVDAANRFFVECLGMRISDEVKVVGAVFLRFDTDHHNLAFLQSSHTWLHHMAWKVASVDEVGYGAMQLIDGNPNANCYGLGRHAASANYFWYLRDPAGSLAEYYYSQFDDLVDDPAFWDPAPDQAPLPVASWGPELPEGFFDPTDEPQLLATAE